MSTPNDPQDPYRPTGEPAQPADPGAPQYPGTPQYPADPQDPAAPQQPTAPQYGQYAPPPEGQQTHPGYPAAAPYPTAPQYGAQGGYVQAYPKNGLAIWSLVLGNAAFVLSCSFITGIPAIILGNKARQAAAEGLANNRGMATAVVVLGWVSVGLAVISLVWLFAFGGWAWYMDLLDNAANA